MPDTQRQNLDNLEMLVTVSRLLSAKLELSDLLVYIMRLSARVVGAERASLYLVDEARNELYFDVALGLPPEIASLRFKPGEGLVGVCWQTGRSLITNDAQGDSRHTQKVDAETGFVTRSILTCPMVIKGHVIGVVQAVNHIDGPFTERDVRNFEAFASHAAIAIENARLFASVREEKRRLQIFFSETREGALLIDSSARVVMANDAAKAYLGGGDVTGALAAKLFDGMTLSPSLDKVFSSGDTPVQFEAARSQPKKLVLEGAVIPLKKRSGGDREQVKDGWLCLFRDVTAARSEQALGRSFFSLISHKLKTPLTVINGYADILGDEIASGRISGFPVKAIEGISAQEKKLTGLVKELLNFVAIDDLEAASLKRADSALEDIYNGAIASGNVKSVERSADGNFLSVPGHAQVSLSADFSAAPKLYCDPELMKDVFAQLVENAVKFNDKPSRMVKINSQARNGETVISFEDNGAGIPPEEFAKVFDKFYQVESSFTGQVEGWGLGLAFVKKVVAAHGGRVELKSTLRAGSVFSIVFPAEADNEK